MAAGKTAPSRDGEPGAAERDANRMHLVARWADDVAHEIKNPLHAMVINLELVKRWAEGGQAASIVERAGIVESELHRVHELVESLLRLLRPWPGAASAVPDRILEVLSPVITARARVRKVGYEHEPGGLPVAMPTGDLALVLLNLIDNALDATPEGGSVRTRCGAGGDVGDAARDVVITVADSGPGLPAALRDRIFEAGVSGREGRAGLGLAIVRALVRRAGGRFSLEEGPAGGGTVATLRIPRSGAA